MNNNNNNNNNNNDNNNNNNNNNLVYATEINKLKFVKKVTEKKEEIENNNEKLNEILKNLNIILERPANSNGSLFASIGISEIKEYFEKNNIKVNNIIIPSIIKTIGTHTINIDNNCSI